MTLKNGATLKADRVDEALESVTVYEDSWIPGEVSVTMREDGEIDKLVGATAPGGSGYGKKVDNTLVGAELATVSASMHVGERIVIKLWVPDEAVGAYFAEPENTVFGVRATIALADGDVVLADYALTEEELSDYREGDYFVFEIGAVSANEFDKFISFKGSCFDVETTILSICETGIEGNFSAAEIDLFKAIYNYGASVCFSPESATYYTFKDLGADFVVDDAADPTYTVGDATKVSFERMNLKMSQ